MTMQFKLDRVSQHSHNELLTSPCDIKIKNMHEAIDSDNKWLKLNHFIGCN